MIRVREMYICSGCLGERVGVRGISGAVVSVGHKSVRGVFS